MIFTVFTANALMQYMTNDLSVSSKPNVCIFRITMFKKIELLVQRSRTYCIFISVIDSKWTWNANINGLLKPSNVCIFLWKLMWTEGLILFYRNFIQSEWTFQYTLEHCLDNTRPK